MAKDSNGVLKEKYEDRGWKQEECQNIREQIKPLPFTEDEYKNFSLLLAKLAIKDQDPKFCEMYFEMQRRASYGNRYSSIDEMTKIEQDMWTLGTGEIIEDIEKHTR